MTSFILEWLSCLLIAFAHFIYCDNTWKQVHHSTPELVSKQINTEWFYGYSGVNSEYSDIQIYLTFSICFFPLLFRLNFMMKHGIVFSRAFENRP